MDLRGPVQKSEGGGGAVADAGAREVREFGEIFGSVRATGLLETQSYVYLFHGRDARLFMSSLGFGLPSHVGSIHGASSRAV